MGLSAPWIPPTFVADDVFIGVRTPLVRMKIRQLNPSKISSGSSLNV